MAGMDDPNFFSDDHDDTFTPYFSPPLGQPSGISYGRSMIHHQQVQGMTSPLAQSTIGCQLGAGPPTVASSPYSGPSAQDLEALAALSGVTLRSTAPRISTGSFEPQGVLFEPQGVLSDPCTALASSAGRFQAPSYDLHAAPTVRGPRSSAPSRRGGRGANRSEPYWLPGPRLAAGSNRYSYHPQSSSHASSIASGHASSRNRQHGGNNPLTPNLLGDFHLTPDYMGGPSAALSAEPVACAAYPTRTDNRPASPQTGPQGHNPPGLLDYMQPNSPFGPYLHNQPNLALPDMAELSLGQYGPEEPANSWGSMGVIDAPQPSQQDIGALPGSQLSLPFTDDGREALWNQYVTDQEYTARLASGAADDNEWPVSHISYAGANATPSQAFAASATATPSQSVLVTGPVASSPVRTAECSSLNEGKCRSWYHSSTSGRPQIGVEHARSILAGQVKDIPFINAKHRAGPTAKNILDVLRSRLAVMSKDEDSEKSGLDLTMRWIAEPSGWVEGKHTERWMTKQEAYELRGERLCTS